jgi:hypothetical protein
LQICTTTTCKMFNNFNIHFSYFICICARSWCVPEIIVTSSGSFRIMQMDCSRNWQRRTEGDQCPRCSPSFNKGRLVQVSLTIHINQNQPLLCTFGCMVTMVKPQSEHGLGHLACLTMTDGALRRVSRRPKIVMGKTRPDGWNIWTKQNLEKFLGCWLHQLPHTYVKEGRVCHLLV